MSAINKMEHYLNSVDRMEVSFADILLKCRALAEEEKSHKAEAPASLVAEIEAYCSDKPDEAHHMGLCEYNNESGNRVKEEIEEIIRKFEGGAK